MSERIDRRLNLVIEVPRGEQPPLFVHSQGISEEIVEQYFDLIGQAMNALIPYGQFAPRWAAHVLKQVALRPLLFEENAERRTKMKAALDERITGFYNELHRLTYVVALKDAKWDMVLIDDAKALGAISEEEYGRIDAAITFFTSASQSVPLEDVESMLGGLNLFHARIESLSCMAFMNSLATLKMDDSSGARQDASPASSNGSRPMPASPPASTGGSATPAFPGNRRPNTGIVITRRP